MGGGGKPADEGALMRSTRTCPLCDGEGVLPVSLLMRVIWLVSFGVLYRGPKENPCGHCEGLGLVCDICAHSECGCYCDSEVEA